jgi:hypothetical protein
LDFGFWILDFGFWILDSGFWILDSPSAVCSAISPPHLGGTTVAQKSRIQCRESKIQNRIRIGVVKIPLDRQDAAAPIPGLGFARALPRIAAGRLAMVPSSAAESNEAHCRRGSAMRIRMLVALWALAALSQAGCATMSGLAHTTSPNPLPAPSADFDTVWKQAVAVVDDYFDIATENRLAGKIITQPKLSATILEPWYGDSVGLYERLESSLQTIRRFAIVTIDESPTGGYNVRVEVFKELEDLAKPDRQQGGRAVFDNMPAVSRTHEIVGPVAVPLQWIPRGRDPKLEQVILARLRKNLYLP